jgi:hypothetical protein
MVLSWTVLNSYDPMRLAGTWKQYSKNAMPQLNLEQGRLPELQMAVPGEGHKDV